MQQDDRHAVSGTAFLIGDLQHFVRMVLCMRDQSNGAPA